LREILTRSDLPQDVYHWRSTSGGRPTAAAVLSDVIAAARGEVGILHRLRDLVASPRARVAPPDEPVYVRSPGISADTLAAGLGDRGFSTLSAGDCPGGAWVIGGGMDRMEIARLLPSAVVAAWPGAEVPVAEAAGREAVILDTNGRS